jgi:acyl-CoA synthetase (AMP-forming)/AMP-acid ligase II
MDFGGSLVVPARCTTDRLDVTPRATSFHELVVRHASERPDAVCVHSIDQDKSLTYAQLRAVSDGLAAFFAEFGIRANDRVLMLAENSVEFHAVFVGVLRYGAAVVTVNVDMNQAHLAEIVTAVRPKIVIVQAGIDVKTLSRSGGERWMELGTWQPNGGSGLFAEIALRSSGADIRSVAGPNDHAVIFYTSGTVAKPKGVIQTHATAFFNYDATADYLGLRPGINVLDCRSFAWLSAQHMALGAPLVAGATAHVARKFSASRYFDWLKQNNIHIGFVVPTMVNMLLSSPTGIARPHLPKLEYLTCSSAPLFVDRWQAFENTFGITLCQSGGSSEGGNTAAHRGKDRKFGTLGPPLKYQKIRIVDDHGADVPPGELGEIIVGGGLQQAFGYLNPDGTIECLAADGHHTGDLGRIDEDGHLVIVGRKKDLIIRGGVNIAPLEIAAILHEIPGIAEAAVAGVPDPIYGEEVAGFVNLAPGVSLSSGDILALCRSKLPAFKVPKSILLLDELPKNARGKIDRKRLVDLWTEFARAR